MKRVPVSIVFAAVAGWVLAGVQMASTPGLPSQAAFAVAQGPQKAPTPPSEIRIPPEEAKRVNPTKPGEESVAAGKRLFETQCAMCHGTAGDGKGDLAIELKMKMPDWATPGAQKTRTDGELFYILTKGHGMMPGQEGRLKVDQKWNLVNYIRSLAKKPEATEKPKP